MKNRTVKQLRRIANRLRLPLRANEKKVCIEQEIVSWLHSKDVWDAIAGVNSESSCKVE